MTMLAFAAVSRFVFDCIPSKEAKNNKFNSKGKVELKLKFQVPEPSPTRASSGWLSERRAQWQPPWPLGCSRFSICSEVGEAVEIAPRESRLDGDLAVDALAVETAQDMMAVDSLADAGYFPGPFDMQVMGKLAVDFAAVEAAQDKPEIDAPAVASFLQGPFYMQVTGNLAVDSSAVETAQNMLAVDYWTDASFFQEQFEMQDLVTHKYFF